MIALIDSDLVAYRCAATCKEEDPVDVAIYRADQLMREIIEATQCDSYMAFLTGSDNFRKHINPQYKANRKDMVPPRYLQDCREYLVTEWKAKLSHGQEADDLLAMNQTADTVICSIDKDLKMIPGRHYNFVKQEWDHVTPEDADKQFWRQMLIGDTSDHIQGVRGLGPKKSAQLIDPCESNQDCLEVILEKYEYDYNRITMNAACLWIKRSEESEWQNDLELTLPNQLKHVVDTQSESMKSFMKGI